METVVAAMRLMQELEAMRPISPEQEARILQKFRLDWNYHSNHLEGNSLSYGETKSLLLYGITAQGKPLKDHIEITGHNEALNLVLEIVKDRRPLTEAFIRELHQLLLKEPYQVDAITPDGQPTKRMIQIGQYKTVPNHVLTVTGETHFFATVEETPAEMQGLMDWYRAQRELPDTNPIFLAALFHHRFIAIHPFDDGNGRTGRLLMNFILMQYGYPPVIIKTEDKSNYYRALQQADGGNTDVFVDYMATNLLRSLQIMLAGARGEAIEEPDDLDKELALLNQRLKGLAKKAENIKSVDTMREITRDTIWNLAIKVKETQAKFVDFYANSSVSVGINQTAFPLEVRSMNLAELLNRIRRNALKILLTSSFMNFQQNGFGEFSFATEYVFEFLEASYQLKVNGKLVQTRAYGDQLTDREITAIVLEEAQRHLQFIQTKLDEFEKRRS